MSYFAFLAEHGTTLLLGTVTTIKVLVCSIILYVIISMIFGLMRLSKNPIIQGTATVYIEFFRGTSLLVKLFWAYYVLPFFGAKEHEEKTGGAFEVTDPKAMPKETVNVVGIGFRKSDNEFREAFNAALAKVLANPGKMLERAGKYGYDKAQLPPPDMTTEWACSTK